MGRVVLGRASTQEAQPALEAKRVRYRADDDTARAEHAADLGDERVGEPQVLEELTRNDGVEARVLEGQRLLDVSLYRLDPEHRRLLERSCVDVETDHRVPVEEVPRQRARAAA